MGLGLRSEFPIAILFSAMALAGCQTTNLSELLIKGPAASGSETAGNGGEPENRVSWALYTPFYDQGDLSTPE